MSSQDLEQGETLLPIISERAEKKEEDEGGTIEEMTHPPKTIALVGLGYVGLPLAVAFARTGFAVTGFDLNADKVRRLTAGDDPTGSVEPSELAHPGLSFTSDEREIRGRDFYIVAIPTPIDAAHKPDLTALHLASELVGRVIGQGAVVCYESTVYPGVTEDFCAPIIERVSGFTRGRDFFIGYSPERINPGDRAHTLESIVKVVSGEDEQTTNALAELYGAVVTAGIHRAPSIRVAEAAKVIENTQRDLNIALMNELAVIFDRLGIPTRDVLEAASTKWNFLRFSPGLVGGHCIGVDPYYLTHKAEEIGYIPQVILAGRRINDSMGKFVRRRKDGQAAHQGGRRPKGRANWHSRRDVQGERARPPQQPRAGHRGRTRRVRRLPVDPRSLRDGQRVPARIRLQPRSDRSILGAGRPNSRRTARGVHAGGLERVRAAVEMPRGEGYDRRQIRVLRPPRR